MNIKDAPERVYITPAEYLSRLYDPEWSERRYFDEDIEYLRSDLVDRIRKKKKAAEIAFGKYQTAVIEIENLIRTFQAGGPTLEAFDRIAKIIQKTKTKPRRVKRSLEVKGEDNG